MKKILFAFSMIFALVSCVSEDLPQTSIPQEGDKVTLTFGVQVPEAGVATRSMADPAVKSLNLLVFDQNGYLVETAQAYVGGSTLWEDKTTPTDATKTQAFTVTLTKTSAYRAIHFVANADVSGLANFGHEDALIPSLVSTDDADAYWQRMEFANGIACDSGTKLDNNTVVPLVRNFAKVTVTENLSNFVLEGFVVMNTRSEGTVAAYNAREREFAEFVNGTTARAYSAMIAEYNGFEAGEQQNATPADAAFTTGAKYVRETAAGATDGTNPYIIVKGKYNGSTTSTYYRLDFVNAGGTSGLAAILRNFSYNFNITSVEKAGMSLDEVMNATEGENNLSFQEATQSLLNISDGTGQLFVSATNVTLVSNEPYILMYKYVPNISTGTTANGSASYARKDAYNADRSAFGSTYYDSAKSGTVASLIAATTDPALKAYYQEFSDYNYITLQPRTPQPNTLDDVIVITGGELAREVRFTLQEKINMTVKAYDGASKNSDKTTDTTVPAATNQKVWVDITIPANLSQYIFPLEFEIEAEALSIYPDAKPTTTVTTAERNNMPVRTGATIIPGQSGNTFRFVRTLSLDEYSALKAAAGTNAETVTFTSQFRTNKADNKSAVYVANHYFNTGNVSFTNGGDAITEVKRNITVTFDNEASYYGAGREVEAEIYVPEAAKKNVTVTVGDGFQLSGTSTKTTDASGYITLNLITANWSGNRSVTVSYDAEIVSGNQVITYADGSATATVNVLHIPAGSFDADNSGLNSQTINMYLGNTNTSLGRVRFNNDGTNQETNLTRTGLEETTELQLRYTVDGGWFGEDTTYAANTTAFAATSSTKKNISFVKQQ